MELTRHQRHGVLVDRRVQLPLPQRVAPALLAAREGLRRRQRLVGRSVDRAAGRFWRAHRRRQSAALNPARDQRPRLALPALFVDPSRGLRHLHGADGRHLFQAV
eukprot:2257241-Prymnesium_polylepis.1